MKRLPLYIKIILRYGFANRKAVLDLIEQLHPRSTQFELIRLGPDTDGGYLLPNDLEGITACFSPGVGDISEFERQCLHRGMKVFMADKTVNQPDWVLPAMCGVSPKNILAAWIMSII